MRGQMVVIASYLAILLVVIVLFYTFIEVMPLTNSSSRSNSLFLNIETIIKRKTNWTAKELVDAIVEAYHPSLVNVSIRAYDILENDTLIWNDSAVYYPYNVSLGKINTYRFVYTTLYRTGYYTEYIIEVGYRK